MIVLRIFLLFLFLVVSLWAHFGEKYEPPDGRILHGLGQFVNLTFYSEEENWQLVAEYQNAVDRIPVIYSAYAYTDSLVDDLDSTSLIDIAKNHSYPYVLLVGISLFDITSTPTSVNIPVTRLLSGALDEQIIKIAQEIKNIYPTPVFVRPGFEFGSGNSGLHNDPDNTDWTAQNFIQIWIRIFNIFEQLAVTNVAWVWNTVNPQSFNFMDWYPGDDYVDWWGINYFTISQINSSNAFLDNAFIHNKPVMVCESNPIENSGTTNSNNWDDWFIPYFTKMKNTSHIKAFIYISDPWDKSGFFYSWPDSRINSNGTILSEYAAELNNSVFIHMDEYQNNPELIDSPLPINLISFNIISKPNANLIEWETSSEINNRGFNIYKAYSKVNKEVHKLDFFNINQSLIPGAGSSSEPHKYQFLDTQVQDQYYYWYYLEDISYNGTITRHEVKKILYKKKVPNNFKVYQNFPNPFNSETTIRFYLQKQSRVNISVYSITGKYIMSLLSNVLSEGYHQVGFNASNLSSGVYLFCIQAGKNSQIRKMIVLE